MLEYSTCPWTSDSPIVIISLFSSEVLSVITVICFNTILCCIFYLLSLGWNITMFRIKRNQLTNLVFVGGSLYLAQLAQNYSQTSTIIPFLFAIGMLIEYTVLAYVTIKNTLTLRKTLGELIAPDQLADIPEACHASLLLKSKQVGRFLIAVCLFYSSRVAVIFYLILDYLVSFDNDYRYYEIRLARDYLEMAAFTIILFTFRPRAQWPEFYGVDIDTAKNSIFRSKQRPILQAVISNKSVLDSLASTETPGKKPKAIKPKTKISELTDEQFDDVMSDHMNKCVWIGFREPILIINPCEMAIMDGASEDSDSTEDSPTDQPKKDAI